MAGYFLPLSLVELTFDGGLEEFVGLVGLQISRYVLAGFEDGCEMSFLLCCGCWVGIFYFVLDASSVDWKLFDICLVHTPEII